ncbi:hypothetical protein ACFQ1L_02445 [Phytohabitans flavus]|uniref:hypothetical protein n=1 Tax=Phytohabitans flavus TaxID=1076124 RepID=UPI003639C165
MVRTTAVAVTALALLGAATPAVAAPAAAAPAGGAISHDEQITFQRWSTYQDWRGGTHQGTVALPGVRTGITIGRPAGTVDYTDPHTGGAKTWAYATWTSPVRTAGFDASELVASWNAETPAGTWIQIEMQGTYNTGDHTPWYVMGRWPPATRTFAVRASTGKATRGPRSGPTRSPSTTWRPACCCATTSCASPCTARLTSGARPACGWSAR